MIQTRTLTRPSFAEFVALVSMMMALTALSIDAMLPALPHIAGDFQVSNPNDRQLVVSVIFLGLGVGQLFFGPLSDSVGRKPALYAGFGLYMVGALMALLAPGFSVLLVGRLLQGIGASSSRAVTLALVRDQYSGRAMARVMSFVMTVFIFVPMIAPTLGQAVLLFAGWRSIFALFILLSLILLVWLALRQPETLPQERRAAFTVRRIGAAIREVVRNRVALGYTVTSGLVSGAFIGYLNSAQQIFQEQYALGELFPLIFAVVASAVGLASFLNARLVMRYGMRLLVNVSLLAIVILAGLALALAFLQDGWLPLPLFLAYLMLSFFCIGILFGNMNALAMEPLGHIAGIGAAVVGALSTLLSAVLGTFIGQSYNGTVLPLVLGLGVLAALSLVVVRWIE
ncbi:multidrug effflux MFS transporter [Litorilinea aerophila]|uniref:Multidrug effflux MFS transporter n=1 Tax=Litorilinea aerophila TaxID=1204385 RepID=A0A540VJ26_9CHLR|nr:multidrug effflux MFS transporter [Litorilinea aerophila]MCC9075641.1 multidrug effflux MFS transporter [Litorilinea aerophila]